MSDAPERRRAEDRGAMAVAGRVAQRTSKSFWLWFSEHHIDALFVLIVTMGLSIKVADWALDYTYTVIVGISGMEKAAILGAVLGPWGLMQAAMFKFYAELRAKSATTNGHT